MVTATFLSTLFYLFVAHCRSCSDSSLGAVALTDGGGKLLHGVDPSIANDRDERQAPALEIVRRLQSFLSGSLGNFHDPRRLTGLSLHNEIAAAVFVTPRARREKMANRGSRLSTSEHRNGKSMLRAGSDRRCARAFRHRPRARQTELGRFSAWCTSSRSAAALGTS